MAQFSRTWWGQRFIQALEEFSDEARLGRGRGYARNGKVKEHQIANGKITAQVRGSVNPYFGVYKEPLYKISIEIEQISAANWSKVIARLGAKASLISKLLLGEVPDNIEATFAELNLHLLPHNRQDFKTDCSCPDYSNPCKHIAGVYYLVAAELDRDPFLLFELRGISRSKLQQELAKSPLGKALASTLDEGELPISSTDSYHTKPKKIALNLPATPKDFWQGAQRLPQTVDVGEIATIPAVVVKKGGNFPPFWTQDNSFIEVMTELYDRVRKKISTETNAGRKRRVQTCVGTLSVSEQQAKKLQLKPRKRLSPWIEKSCLLLSANVSYENAARDFEELTGIAIGHSTQQRLVHRTDYSGETVTATVNTLSGFTSWKICTKLVAQSSDSSKLD